MDVVVWLRSLGLGQYEALFRENDIDETVLPNLTAEDLRELGVASLGHRRKLLDAIAALRTDASGKAPTADVTTSSSAPSISPVTYWRFCEGLIDPVASSGVLDQLHARPIFSLISDTPDSTKFVSLFSPAAVRALTDRIIENPLFDRAGQHIGRAQMILGLLYKTKKRRALAIQHLTEARRIFSQFGQTPTLARVETALAKLGQ